jgi:hypothetical protein
VCRSRDLADRNGNPAWQRYVGQLVDWETAKGLQLAIVANPRDKYVPFGKRRWTGR